MARHRSRLVALGNYQRPGLDYDLTYSPVVKTRSVGMLFAFSTELGWDVDHVDIVAAYLTADLKEEMYIEVPDGFIEVSEELRQKYDKIPDANSLKNGRSVIRLKKCMYDLHQSGRAWYEKIDKFLKKIRMKPCVSHSLRLYTLRKTDSYHLACRRSPVFWEETRN